MLLFSLTKHINLHSFLLIKCLEQENELQIFDDLDLNYCMQAWIFGLSLLGLAPLAERVSFLTELVLSPLFINLTHFILIYALI